MGARDLLLEIGTEEIPSRFIPPTLSELAAIAEEELRSERLVFENTQTLGTPRRIVLIARSLEEKQQDKSDEFKGPAWASAFDPSGNPTKAARGFAKSKGVDVDSLERRDFGGQEFAVAVKREEGRPSSAILPAVLEKVIKRLSFPKSMYWDRTFQRFARPVRWLLALYGDELLRVDFGLVSSDRFTRGHRFMGVRKIEVSKVGEYLEKLHDNFVIADPQKRREKMLAGIASIEKEMGGKAALDADLVEENLYLVEYPVPFYGFFDRSFLQIPEEVLVTTMKNHQRYFPVRDCSGNLKPCFIGVSNNRAANMSVVREGNERVLRARLSDASFFWEEDQKVPLSARVDSLKKIVHHEKLGTVYEKVSQVRELCGALCRMMDLPAEETEMVDRAAFLAKADSVTDMVYEFPELRGVMGREYAARDGENPRVALALFEQYLPSSSGDRVPSDIIGAILGVCDRIDTITGGFKAGLQPTGSQDQYGIRRASRTLNEILWGMDLDVDIDLLVKTSSLSHRLSDDQKVAASGFILQRLYNQLREKGFSHELTTLAVSAVGSRPNQALKLLKAFQEVQGTDWFAGLVTSAVRVRNILQKTDHSARTLDASLFTEAAERELHEAVELLSPRVDEAVRAWDWNGLTLVLSKLEPYISAFFDKVLVMDNDERIRNNRIALLERCDGLFKTSGDLGLLKA